MAEKFDMIARVEDGADPIQLGIAAAAEEGDMTAEPAATVPAAADVAPGLQAATWDHAAADAAVELAAAGTKLLDLKAAGSFEKLNDRFTDAMDLGRQATLEVLKVSQGLLLPANDALQTVPIMQPPNKSFCPKCGSDIHANAMLQWNKWSDAATELLTIQLEAAMRSSLMHLAASYRDKIRTWKTNFRTPKRHSVKQEKKPRKHRLQKRRRRRLKRRNPKARQRPPPRLHLKRRNLRL